MSRKKITTTPSSSPTTQPGSLSNFAQPAANTATATKGDLDKKAEGLMRKVSKKLTSVANEFEIRIEEKETKTTEILAIFMTLFTFISVNVSVFTKVKDLITAICFMMIMTMCSTFLLSFTLIVTSKRLPNKITTYGLILSLGGLTLISTLFYLFKLNFPLNTQ